MKIHADMLLTEFYLRGVKDKCARDGGVAGFAHEGCCMEWGFKPEC